MRRPRVYQQQTLNKSELVTLDDQASHHVLNVLRLKPEHELVVFNNSGYEYTGVIDHIVNKQAVVRLTDSKAPAVESPLNLNLAQGLAKGDKMDWVVEKAVELGVNSITPLQTDRSQIKLTEDKRQKRTRHWQRIATNAAEQSGRVMVPQLYEPLSFSEWLGQIHDGIKLAFCAGPDTSPLSEIPITQQLPVYLIIGPEGGFSEKERDWLKDLGFYLASLGPRTLRTETAGLAGLAALQTLYGDF